MTRRLHTMLALAIPWLTARRLARPGRAEPTPAAAPVTTLVVIATGLDEAGLREALALRVPSARIVGYVREDMPCESGCVIAQVRRGAGGLRIEVQLAD